MSELWTAAEIAAYCKLESEDVVRRAMVCRPGFPRPVAFSGRGTGKKPRRRWYSDEVQKWIRENCREA
jgi:predicted DNA-binding transcriptional regulator AlpA